jgi:hypothetical protein
MLQIKLSVLLFLVIAAIAPALSLPVEYPAKYGDGKDVEDTRQIKKKPVPTVHSDLGNPPPVPP